MAAVGSTRGVPHGGTTTALTGLQASAIDGDLDSDDVVALSRANDLHGPVSWRWDGDGDRCAELSESPGGCEK
jgi:hypothetical protein